MRKGSESKKQHLLVMIETAQRRGFDEEQITAMVEEEVGLGPELTNERRRPALKDRLLAFVVDRKAA